jgi:hypothetical protein
MGRWRPWDCGIGPYAYDFLVGFIFRDFDVGGRLGAMSTTTNFGSPCDRQEEKGRKSSS